MPPKSKAQRRAAGIALAAKRGEISPKSLKGASRSMYESMNKRQLEEYASGSEARKPYRKPKKKRARRKTSVKHKKKGR